MSGDVEWRIYYSRGTFDSTQGPPEHAPPGDIQAIVQLDPSTGREVMSGWNWYYWRVDKQRWWGSDIHGLLAKLRRYAHVISAVVEGEHCETDYEDVLHAATVDPDFPTLTATRRTDRPR